MSCVKAKRFTGFMPSGMEIPELESPREGRHLTSGSGREVQVAAGHNLPFIERARPTAAFSPMVVVSTRAADSKGWDAVGNNLPQGRTPHTQDPSPAVKNHNGVNGIRCVWADANHLQNLRQNGATVAVNN